MSLKKINFVDGYTSESNPSETTVTGPTGPQGDQGIQGIQGTQGIQGDGFQPISVEAGEDLLEGDLVRFSYDEGSSTPIVLKQNELAHGRFINADLNSTDDGTTNNIYRTYFLQSNTDFTGGNLRGHFVFFIDTNGDFKVKIGIPEDQTNNNEDTKITFYNETTIALAANHAITNADQFDAIYVHELSTSGTTSVFVVSYKEDGTTIASKEVEFDEGTALITVSASTYANGAFTNADGVKIGKFVDTTGSTLRMYAIAYNTTNSSIIGATNSVIGTFPSGIDNVYIMRINESVNVVFYRDVGDNNIRTIRIGWSNAYPSFDLYANVNPTGIASCDTFNITFNGSYNYFDYHINDQITLSYVNGISSPIIYNYIFDDADTLNDTVADIAVLTVESSINPFSTFYDDFDGENVLSFSFADRSLNETIVLSNTYNATAGGSTSGVLNTIDGLLEAEGSSSFAQLLPIDFSTSVEGCTYQFRRSNNGFYHITPEGTYSYKILKFQNEWLGMITADVLEGASASVSLLGRVHDMTTPIGQSGDFIYYDVTDDTLNVLDPSLYETYKRYIVGQNIGSDKLLLFKDYNRKSTDNDY